MGVEFVKINVSTTGLYSTNTTDYGTVGIVGDGDTSNTDPILIGSVSEAASTFGSSTLYEGIKAALVNGAAKVWAVDTGTVTLASVVTALAKLEGYDIQFVALAGIVETADDTFISTALANHVVASITDRIGVFQLKKGDDATTMPTSIGTLLTSNSSRLVGIAHNSNNDVACSVAGLMARLKPWESIQLKPLENVAQTINFTDTQTSALITCQLNILAPAVYSSSSNPIIFGNYTLGSSTNGLNYIDTRRVVDDITYQLKTKLTDPTIIGEVRINKSGLATLLNRIAGTLQNCVTSGEIGAYSISIPVLNAISKEAASGSDSLSSAETALIQTTRSTRSVAGTVAIEYEGVLHYIDIDLSISYII